MALLGPNGAGKTAEAVRCLTGLYKPDKGDILIEGLGDINVQKKVASFLISHICIPL